MEIHLKILGIIGKNTLLWLDDTMKVGNMYMTDTISGYIPQNAKENLNLSYSYCPLDWKISQDSVKANINDPNITDSNPEYSYSPTYLYKNGQPNYIGPTWKLDGSHLGEST